MTVVDVAVPKQNQRRMLRAVEAGIDVAEGTYPAADGSGPRRITHSDLTTLHYLRYDRYITGALTLTDKGHAALDELRRRTDDCAPAGPEVLDRSTCVSAKVRFDSEADAARYVGQYRKTKKAHGPRLRHYQCPWCAGHHVTKKQTWAPRKAKGSWT